MPNVVARVIPLVVVLFALVESACDDKPTPPHVYSPYPQQLYDLSADSHYVYFRDDGTAFGRPAGIYRFPLDGNPVVEPVVVHPSAYFPRISPSGRRLAFVDLANALIIRDIAKEKDSVILRADVVDIDWYNEDTLICGVYHGQVISVEITTSRTNVIWSGNGWQTTVAEQGRVAMIEYYAETAIVDSSAVIMSDVGGSPAQLLTIFRKDYCAAPELSGRGDRIVLIRDFLLDPRLALVTVPGGVLTDSLALFAADPYYLDDHRVIYIHLGDKSIGGTDQIWIMNDDGSGMRCLLPNEAAGSMAPAESPLGRH